MVLLRSSEELRVTIKSQILLTPFRSLHTLCIWGICFNETLGTRSRHYFNYRSTDDKDINIIEILLSLLYFHGYLSLNFLHVLFVLELSNQSNRRLFGHHSNDNLCMRLGVNRVPNTNLITSLEYTSHYANKCSITTP